MKQRINRRPIKITSKKELNPSISQQQEDDGILTKAETLNIICERAIQILSAPKKNTH
jgi:hypothetical protein